MKKRFFKKVLAMVLALTMLITLIPAQHVDAEDVQQKAQTILQEGVQTQSEEEQIEPVIEGFTFVEKGQDVMNGSQLHVRVTAYLGEGTEFSATNSFLVVENVITGEGAWISGSTITSLGNDEYEIVFENLDVYAVGEWRLIQFGLSDDYDNTCYLDIEDAEMSFNLCREAYEGLTITNIALSETEVALTDELLNKEVTVEVEVSYEGEEIPMTELQLWYVSVNERGSLFYITTFYDEETGKYAGCINVEYGIREDEYRFFFAEMEGLFVECSVEESVLVIVHNNTDHDAPVVESIEVYSDGVIVEAGTEVALTDTLEYRVKLNEDSGVSYVELELSHYSMNDENRWQVITLEYDETLDCYVGEVILEDYYPTMWFIQSLYAADIFLNEERYEYQTEHYFYLQDDEGNCDVPTYNLTIWCCGESYGVTVECITSLTEMFPDGLPEVPEKEGCTHIGWYINGQYVDEDDPILLYESDFELYPVYDNLSLNLVVEYIDENGQWVEVRENILVAQGTTYEELEKIINEEYVVKHYEGLTFEAFALNNITEENKQEAILPYEYYIVVRANYEENGITVIYEYIDEYGEAEYCSQFFVVEEGTTIAEVLKTATTKEVSHMEELGFVEWTYDLEEEQLNGTIESVYAWVYLVAEYEKIAVFLSSGYYDEYLRYQWTEELVVCEKGDTFIDALDKALNVKHPEALKFVEWDIWADCSDLNEPVYPYACIYAEAVYENVVVGGNINYFGINGAYEDWTFNIAAEPNETYAEVLERAVSQYEHSADVTLKEWGCNLTETEMAEEVGTDPGWLYVWASYEEIILPVEIYYLDKNNEPTYTMEFCIVEQGTTYQQAYDSLKEKYSHSDTCGFVDWNVFTMETEDLSLEVLEDDLMVMVAEYEKYPVTYSYTYLTTENETKTVTERIYVNAGTKLTAYFDELTLPEDAREVAAWHFDCYATMEANAQVTEVNAAAAYEDVCPIYTVVDYVNKDNQYVIDFLFVYVDNTLSEEDLYNVVYEEVMSMYGEMHGATLLDVYVPYISVESTELEEGYYYGAWGMALSVYKESVLIVNYPDGSKETVILRKGDEYVLPTHFNSTELYWNVDGYKMYGGETVSYMGSYTMEITAIYAELAPVAMDKETLQETVEAIEGAQEGDTITVDMTKEEGVVATEVPIEVLEAIQGKDIQVVLDMGDYSWSINGKNVTAEDLETVYLEVTLDADEIDANLVESIANGDEALQISLRHDGDFGFTADLTLNLGSENQGQYGTLYYYNEYGRLEFMSSVLIDENGNVVFEFTHASDYVIVIGEERTADTVQVNPFTDVPEGIYYYEPVLWAYSNGITSGLTETTFAPNNTCTRAEFVTFLWRAAGRPEPTTAANPFTDVSNDIWYTKAVLWAVENGITFGLTETTFAPNNTCTRAEVVTFLWRASGKQEPTTTENAFTDVTDGIWYEKAVLWAVENRITFGLSDTTFAPNNTCTRGETVTFLYRVYKQ